MVHLVSATVFNYIYANFLSGRSLAPPTACDFYPEPGLRHQRWFPKKFIRTVLMDLAEIVKFWSGPASGILGYIRGSCTSVAASQAEVELKLPDLDSLAWLP